MDDGVGEEKRSNNIKPQCIPQESSMLVMR